MMDIQRENEVCKYFLMGNCKRGDKCKFLHFLPQGNNSQGFPQQSQQQPQQPQSSFQQQQQQGQSHICRHFMKDACTRNNCAFFHGYLEKLQFVEKIEGHQKTIQAILSMDDQKFITSDSNEFFVRTNTDYKANYKNTIDSEYKIGKIVFFNNKVICGVERTTL